MLLKENEVNELLEGQEEKFRGTAPQISSIIAFECFDLLLLKSKLLQQHQARASMTRRARRRVKAAIGRRSK